ncbi:MAG: serine protease [Bacteroidota bacterium]
MYNLIEHNEERTIAESIVVIVKIGKYAKEDENGNLILKTKVLKDRAFDKGIKICTTHPWSSQRTIFSQGSGFFIAEGIIATAAHTILDANSYKNTNCSQIRFIVNFDHLPQDKSEVLIKAEKVFKPIDIWDKIPPAYFDYTSTNQDWALIPVVPNMKDKSAPVFPPALPMLNTSVSKNDRVKCIGHPFGLPSKVSNVGNVIRVDSELEYFEASIGAFAGNSGAPIIETSTNKVVGILTRGLGQMSLSADGECIQLDDVRLLFEGEECQKLNFVIPPLDRLRIDHLGTPITI